MKWLAPVQALEHLEDARGKRAVFVSHCLLNENTRYAGGAFRQGGVDELIDDFQRNQLGIVQMRCPEQCAWGGVRKRYFLPAYCAHGSLLSPLLRVITPLFLWYTRWRYRRLAHETAREITGYCRSNMQVVGVVGVGGSPSCGVWTTLDVKRSLAVIAQRIPEKLDRETMNEQAIVACRRPGSGLFVAALQRELGRRGYSMPWYEHDIVNEIRGRPIPMPWQATTTGLR